MKLKLLSFIALLSFVLISFQVGDTKALFTDTGMATGNFSTGFWVLPTVTVTAPNGGETLYQGDTYNITWTATTSDPGATVSIDLYYSTDGGITYPNTIATGETNDGSYSWTVPAIFSSSVKVKIVATDSHGLIGSDESNANFTIDSGIVMNEFLPNPAGSDDALKPGGEWVELYNNGSVAVDVNDWVLYDVDDTHELVVSASNTNTGATTVAAGGFLVVYRNGDGDFVLNNIGGDTLRLYNNAIGSGGILIDSYTYVTDAADGKSYARIPDGIGAWVDPDPTPGGPNVLTENYLQNLAVSEITESTSSATPSAIISNESSQLSLAPQAESTPPAEVQIIESTPSPTPISIPTPTVTPESSPTPGLSPTPTPEQSNEPETIVTPDPPQEGDS